MKDLLTVSIGTPAYNEEANIKNLLELLIAQNLDNIELKEIIVISDGSTDGTVAQAQSVADDRILVLDKKDRKGVAERQNEILDLFQGDTLILLDADILPSNQELISNLVKPFRQIERLGIVGAVGEPMPARLFFEKIINFSVSLQDEMKLKYNGGDNMYLCRGFCRAFSREMAKSFKWPASVGEDVYSYLVCIKNGYKFFLSRDSIVKYRSPESFRDHLKQSIRFKKSRQLMQEYFDPDFVNVQYSFPKSLFISTLIKYLLKNPSLFFSYILIFITSEIMSKFSGNKPSNTWDPSASSKKLS